VSNDDVVEPPQSSEIQSTFAKGTLEEKKKALKTLIKLVSNDDNYPRLLMAVLTNLQLLQDHELKKLLFLYWEVVEKVNLDGSVKDEITLACNALRKDLLSPNEYIRGRTLRLVSKISIKSILENLSQAVVENLAHRHFYVRRNAIMCIYSIFTSTGPELIEDCVDQIEALLINETDLSTKRNAFFLLFHLAQEKALSYLKTVMTASDSDPLAEMGDIFQLIVLEMLRKLCKIEPAQKQRLMNAIFLLSNSKSSSVLFECANTITQLTTAPTAIKIAIQSYLNLLQEQNDNNVKLIVLNKIIELRGKYAKLLEDYISDILNTINEEQISSLDINQKVLELTTELASSRNIKEIIAFLEKEITRARKMDESGDQATTTNEYRYMLIKSVNQLTQTFPETIPSFLRPLMDSFLMFDN
jgi:coatomer subunit beta